jgi:NTE family protein
MKLTKGMKRIGLALGGGGAKGLSHIAFLKALDEMGIHPTIISGTSIGAVVGAMYAGGLKGGQIERIFDDMGIRRMTGMMDFSVFSTVGILKGKKVEEFLMENLPARTFEKLSIPLCVVATDFWKREEVVFRSGDLIPAIRASISVPVMLEPLQLEGRVLTDGGTVNPLPGDLIRDECDILVAIDVSGAKVPDEEHPVPSMMENVFSTFQILQASIVRSKMASSHPDIFIQPKLANIQFMDFYKKDEILDGVAGDVERFRRELKEILEGKS